jgi:uncharacterized membrane protein YkgB
MNFRKIDLKLIKFFRKSFEPIARFGLFVIFFWFGILKILDLSPASGVVQRLFESTIHFISFPTFIIIFGIFECTIGIMFLIKGLERVVIPLLFIHMITTFGPLVLLPSETWQKFLVPTLEGQYIIKNLVVIATGIGIAAKLEPIKNN